MLGQYLHHARGIFLRSALKLEVNNNKKITKVIKTNQLA
jgi:hypothetical protein